TRAPRYAAAHGSPDKIGRNCGRLVARATSRMGARGRGGGGEALLVCRLRYNARVRGTRGLLRREAGSPPGRGAGLGACARALVDARRGRRNATGSGRGGSHRQDGRMNEGEAISQARQKLRAHIEVLVGPGPIARFEEALTHPSYGNEVGTRDNQRLEFLGDA